MKRSLVAFLGFLLLLPAVNGLEVDGNVDILWNTSGFDYYGVPAIGDFNGDGALDVVLVNYDWNANAYTVTAFSGADGSVLWTYSTSEPCDIVGSSHDFNGDGINDVLLHVDRDFRLIADTGETYRSWYYVALDGSNGNKLWNTSLIEETFSGEIGWSMREKSADITGDGIEDVIVSFEADIWDGNIWNRIGAQNDIIAISGSSGDLLWKRTYNVSGDDSWLVIKIIPVGNIDGTGGAEVLLDVYGDWYNQTSGMRDGFNFKEVVDYKNDTLLMFLDNIIDIALPGDLDGDGLDDLVVYDWYNNSILAVRWDGSTIWSKEGYYSGLVGDVNRDGVADVLIENASGWEMLHMVNGRNGTDIWTTNYTGWASIMADLDDDNLFDIVLMSGYCEFDSNTGRVTTCNRYLNAIEGETGRLMWNLTLYENESATSWIKPYSVDISGDGVVDLIGTLVLYDSDWYSTLGRQIFAIDGRNGSIMWRYWINESDGWMYYEIYPVGDFNGDGKDDILIPMERYSPASSSGIASVNAYSSPITPLPDDVPEYYRRLTHWKDYGDTYYGRVSSINSYDGLPSVKSFDSTVQGSYLYLSVLVSGDNPDDVLWLASSDSWVHWISKRDYEEDLWYYGWFLPPKKVNWSIDFNGDGLSDVAYSSNGDFGVLFYNNTQVTNLHPVAAFTYSPEYPAENESIVFDASLSIDFDGQIVSYQWDFGDGTTASGMTVNHSFSTGGNYYVVLTVTDDGGFTSSHGEWIHVAVPFTPDQYEPDDTMDTATLINIFEIQHHNFHQPGDQDWVKFYATAGMTYVVETFNLSYNSDTYIYLYDSSGNLLAENDDYNGLASRIEWTCQQDGYYYVMVRHFSSSTYGDGTDYWIRVYTIQSQITYFNISLGTKLIYVWNNTLHHPEQIVDNNTLTEMYFEPWGDTYYFFDFDNSLGVFGHYGLAITKDTIERRDWHLSSSGATNITSMYPALFHYMTIPDLVILKNSVPGDTSSYTFEFSWYNSSGTYSILINATYTFVNFENITTPAGTFYCAKIITYLDSADTFISGTRTMWIGEPGLVKLVYNHSDGSTTRVELAEISSVQLPLDLMDISVTPGDGYVDVNVTWVGDGYIMLGPINFTAFDYVYINATTPTTETFRLNLPPSAPSDYYFVHVVDGDQYFHFGDRVYVENSAIPLLTVPSTTVVVNATADVPMFLSTSVNVTGINFTLNYDPAIVQIESYSPTVPSTAFANIDNVNGTAKFAIIFNSTISGNTVPFLNITIRAVSAGITDLSVSGIEVSLTDFSPIPAVAMNGTLTVIGQKGDIDGDGKVTIGDITNLAWMLFGKVQQDSKADFNGNGRIDIGDLAKLAYYVLGKITEL